MYETVWERLQYTDYEANEIASSLYYKTLETGAMDGFEAAINEIIPQDSPDESYKYVSITQVINLLNLYFGHTEFNFIELSRRVDKVLDGIDYHFIVREMLVIPMCGFNIIREGVESLSNKGFKEGFRGLPISEIPSEEMYDLSAEGVLSLWKNAEADAKKRCGIDIGIGSQFISDPLANEKSGKKIKKVIKNSKSEPEAKKPEETPVILKEDDLVTHTNALIALKVVMKKHKMKAPDLYVICPEVLGRPVSKMKELGTGEVMALTEKLKETDNESEGSV